MKWLPAGTLSHVCHKMLNAEHQYFLTQLLGQTVFSFERAYSKKAGLAQKFAQRVAQTQQSTLSPSSFHFVSVAEGVNICEATLSLSLSLSPLFFTNLRKCCPSLHAGNEGLPTALARFFAVSSAAQTTITQDSVSSRDSLWICESPASVKLYRSQIIVSFDP